MIIIELEWNDQGGPGSEVIGGGKAHWTTEPDYIWKLITYSV